MLDEVLNKQILYCTSKLLQNSIHGAHNGSADHESDLDDDANIIQCLKCCLNPFHFFLLMRVLYVYHVPLLCVKCAFDTRRLTSYRGPVGKKEDEETRCRNPKTTPLRGSI